MNPKKLTVKGGGDLQRGVVSHTLPGSHLKALQRFAHAADPRVRSDSDSEGVHIVRQ